MDLLAELRARRGLCILRAPVIPDPVGLARVLVEAGLPIIEFAFTTPDAARLIERASTVDGAMLGAGTVLTVAQARAAISAGAKFLLAPGMLTQGAGGAARAGAAIVSGRPVPHCVGEGAVRRTLSVEG